MEKVEVYFQILIAIISLGFYFNSYIYIGTSIALLITELIGGQYK